jgi:hypothetical protein
MPHPCLTEGSLKLLIYEEGRQQLFKGVFRNMNVGRQAPEHPPCGIKENMAKALMAASAREIFGVSLRGRGIGGCDVVFRSPILYKEKTMAGG